MLDVFVLLKVQMKLVLEVKKLTGTAGQSSPYTGTHTGHSRWALKLKGKLRYIIYLFILVDRNVRRVRVGGPVQIVNS